ncbi:unnamed protein product, partial [marine sediment metagenome]
SAVQGESQADEEIAPKNECSNAVSELSESFQEKERQVFLSDLRLV